MPGMDGFQVMEGLKVLPTYDDNLEIRVRERTADLQESYLETMITMTRAAEHKDEDTGVHVKRSSYVCPFPTSQ